MPFLFLSGAGPATAAENPLTHHQQPHKHTLKIPHNTGWLGVTDSKRFQNIADYDFEKDPRYLQRVKPYLKDRGVTDEKVVEELVREDLHDLAQALTIMFDADEEKLISDQLPPELATLLEGTKGEIDHVGRELYGPIDFYFALLMETIPGTGLKHVPRFDSPNSTSNGNILFPSTSVVLEVQKYNPSVKEVAVGRIYFTDKDAQNRPKALELFQTITERNQYLQSYRGTVIRMSNLYADISPDIYKEIYIDKKIPVRTPIDHIAVRVSDEALVYEIQQGIVTGRIPGVKAYQDRVGINPADGSVNTKLLSQAKGFRDVYNKILEIVFYRDLAQKK